MGSVALSVRKLLRLLLVCLNLSLVYDLAERFERLRTADILLVELTLKG